MKRKLILFGFIAEAFFCKYCLCSEQDYFA
jgi:hypothetical protein